MQELGSSSFQFSVRGNAEERINSGRNNPCMEQSLDITCERSQEPEDNNCLWLM